MRVAARPARGSRQRTCITSIAPKSSFGTGWRRSTTFGSSCGKWRRSAPRSSTARFPTVLRHLPTHTGRRTARRRGGRGRSLSRAGRGAGGFDRARRAPYNTVGCIYVRSVRGEWGMRTSLRRSSGEREARPPALPPTPRTARVQTRRAWRVLLVSFTCFSILIGGLGVGFATYRTNATKPRGGMVSQIVTGNQAQVRSRQQSFWYDVGEGSAVNEGDTVRTGDDTRMRIALFDDTIVELSANTIVLVRQAARVAIHRQKRRDPAPPGSWADDRHGELRDRYITACRSTS